MLDVVVESKPVKGMQSGSWNPLPFVLLFGLILLLTLESQIGVGAMGVSGGEEDGFGMAKSM